MFKISKISILIPYQPTNKAREISFNWIVNFYKITLPEAQICIGYTSNEFFSRSLAINKAARKATGDVFVIVDADIICSPDVIRNAVNSLNEAAWIIPFTSIEDISQNSTLTLFKQPPKWPILQHLKTSKRLKGGIRVGGINILRKESFYSVGGFDERFIGWGGEDDAFCSAMNTICGDFTRLNESVFHLWHPPAKARSNPKHNNNVKLAHQYRNASGNIPAMLEIINKNKMYKNTN
ncbi:glycosyltransferase [Rossellomorea aquimaris]|uniref:galactosyltransferase-related protein n=1 Tax=Rossellomorea aquimaris TaxID=189382 RepID=UPI001CD1FFC5|nr:galactosyltransferase-related protein [Rossellomorea aquimaris]MCA1059074.1 glycosyltransferase [Rossellomorea aquimaris]